MRAVPLLCLAFVLAGASAAHATPTIVSLEVEGLPVLGEPVTIAVVGTDAERSLIGAAIADGGSSFAESACRLDRRGRDATGGPFAPGRQVGFELPFEPATPGVHLVTTELTSGGCSGAAETVAEVLTVTVSLPLLGATASARGRAAACADADTAPAAGNLGAIRTATVCLLNDHRARAGLKSLSEDRRLRKAALRHSRDMVRRTYFDHSGPNGPTLVARLSKVDFRAVRAAENIGTGSAGATTPRGMVDAWMDSDIHRANILTGSFKRIGVGVVDRDTAGRAGGTYTADFGS